MSPDKQYTDDEIIEMVRRVKDDHGKVTPRLFNQYADHCSPALVMRRFESWADAKEAAGIEEDLSSDQGREKKYSDEQLLSHLREIQRRHGKCTTDLLLDADDLAAPSVVSERFGSWMKAKRKAGLEDDREANSRPEEYSDEDYLEMIRACAEKHGKATQQLFNQDEEFATDGAIRDRFGSWSEAVEQAGVERNAGGGTSKYDNDDLLEMLKACQEKHGKCTVRTFASDDEFCSPETIQRRFGSWTEAKRRAGV
jgi:hypothetical protein